MYLPNFNLRLLLLSLLGLMFINGSANALESDKHQPIDIAADNAILDDKAGKAIYRGNVELTQGTLKIVAEQLTIETGQEGKVEKVIAKGELAHFTQIPNENDKPIEAQANTVEYFVTKEKIVLIEKAKVVQNENLFEGNIIEYDMKLQKLQAHGKTLTGNEDTDGVNDGRVKMILQPQTEATSEEQEEPQSTEAPEENASDSGLTDESSDSTSTANEASNSNAEQPVAQSTENLQEAISAE